MIYQIAGLVITVTAAVCATVYGVNYTKTRAHAERMDRAQRIAAETTVNTKEFIITQKDKEIERLKGLLKLAEGRDQ